jgi:DNA repair protein radc
MANDLLTRYRQRGASALSDAEVVAAVCFAQPQPEQIAKAVLALGEAGSLAKYVQQHDRLALAMELCTRVMAEALLTGPALGSPSDTGTYLTARLRHLPYEVFAVVFLTTRHTVIAMEEMFRGTLDGASVFPREVVRAALKHNAAAVIFAHAHPSGVAEPSAADRAITRELTEALRLIGVRVLDHLVIGAGAPTSMAARGLM